MGDSGPISYLATEVGERLIGMLHSFVFIVVNALIFLIFSAYFSLNPLVFALNSIISFLLIGKINRWKAYLWFVGLFILLFLNIPYKLTSLSIFVAVSIFISVFLMRKSGKDYSTPFKLTKELGLKFFITLPRILFYNISYQLFPLLFIWLGITGLLFYFLNIIYLVGNLTHFVYVITISGVVLGFLQFYLQRHEKKVQKKINKYFTSQIPWKDKFTFNEFKKFLEGKGGKRFNELKKCCGEIAEDLPTEFMKSYKPFRMKGKPIEKYDLNVYLTNTKQIDQVRFARLERETKENNKYKVLRDAYSEFFEEKKKEIVEKEINEKEIEKLSWNLLENINILEESFPTLLSVRDKTNEKPETYDEFLSKTKFEILEEAISIAIGMK